METKNNELTQERLREVVAYNAETGEFSRVAPRYSRPTGTINTVGYLQIYIDGKIYLGHRVAWLYVYGEWPIGCVDHINGNRSDNRIKNLRVGSKAQNLQNQRRPRAGNPYLGVSLHKHAQKWHARIVVDGNRISLGYYDTPEAARDAYVAAKREKHAFCTL